jgi:translation initiation factor 1A
VSLLCRYCPLTPSGPSTSGSYPHSSSERVELIRLALTRSEYAQVQKMLGNGKVEVLCFDGEKRTAHIRGKMRKKVRPFSWLPPQSRPRPVFSLRPSQVEKPASIDPSLTLLPLSFLFSLSRTLHQVWINQGDIILISLRDFQDEKADVIVKYTSEEARNLKTYGELPDTAKINETDTFGDDGDDDGVEFGGDSDIDDI